MSSIVFENVSRVFQRNGEDLLTLDGISLDIHDKEFVAVVGPSGCGKTTCLRMAAGLEFPSSGAVSVAGKEVKRPGPERAVVFQQFALFPWKTVWQNIDFGLRSKGLAQGERRDIIEKYLRLMNLTGCETAYPHQLSGGMQQRVQIARSLAQDPDTLLMDEPFGALDAMTREQMNLDLQRIWMENRKTVFLITHSIPEAVFLGDRVVVMTARPGRLLDDQAVPFARPRQPEIRETPEFGKMRSALWAHLRSEVERQIGESKAG